MSENEKYPMNKAKDSENNPMEGVYAGPPPAPTIRQSAEMPVYAGPEFYNRGSRNRRMGARFEAVYAAPARFDTARKNEAEMNDVYAGPEYFERNADEPAEDIPEEIKQPPMMMVYAGPEYFNSSSRPLGAFSQGEYCANCGTPVKKEYNFCPECGTRIIHRV